MTEVNRYNTKQRERIRILLEKNKDRHMTADDIYESLREGDTAIGVSTIYRYLNLLVRQGLVRKFLVEKGQPACYQYYGESPSCCEHFHLKCNNCGKLFHVKSELLEKAKAEIEDDFGFIIDSSKTVFYGKCADCGKEDLK